LDCKDYADQIPFYAAGALNEEEMEQVRQHLASGCPLCAGRLAEVEAMMALLALTLPREEAPQEARQRLLDRVAAQALPIAPAAAEPARSAGWSAGPWWAQLAVPSAIAASIAAGLTIFFFLRVPPRSAGASSTGNMTRTLSMLAATLEQQEQSLDLMRSNGTTTSPVVHWASDPNLKTIALNGTSQQPLNAKGRVFWDVDRGMWHFYATGLAAPPAGKIYELWFVSADGKTALPAGSFNPTPSGDATLAVKVPASIAGKLAVAAVTDEPAGQSILYPSGSFQLEGRLQ
jgi:anti-sigma-K factor RskA